MRTRTTLILAALALAAALFFYLVDRPRHARETERIALDKRLTSVRANDVHSVSIDRPDVGIRAVRSEGRWQLISPVSERAHDPALNVLVLTTCNADVDARFEAEESGLSEYGLSAPSATVRFAAADGGRLLELRIGDLNPSKSRCYALAENAREVLLLPTGVRRYALRSLFEFRDKRIVEVELADVGRIEVTSRRGSMIWTADGHGGWFTVQDADTVPGDIAAVELIVRQLRGLRARDIPIGEPPETVSQHGELFGTIRLSTRGHPAEISIAFSPPQGDSCYVTPSHTRRTALVDTTMIPLFTRTLDDFRDKRLLFFDEDALARISWKTPERSVTIVKRDGAWNHVNPGFGRISGAGARRLLSTMAAIGSIAVLERRFAEPTGYGLDAPVGRLTLLDADGRLVDELVVGLLEPGGTSRYVWSQSTRALAAIDPAAVARIEDDLSTLGNP